MARLNYKEVLKGDIGYTYTPHVTNEGILYWTNNGKLPNPKPVNIKGRDGDIAQSEIIEDLQNNINNKINKNRVYAINDKYSEYGIVDVANFSRQGEGNEPIGFVLHHYTDGNCVQIDNVGRGNFIVTLKNAYNPKRRSDKDDKFFGYGDYLSLTESYLNDMNEVKGRDWFYITKRRVFNCLYGIFDFLQSKKDDGTWGYRFNLENKHNNIISIKNGINNFFTGYINKDKLIFEKGCQDYTPQNKYNNNYENLINNDLNKYGKIDIIKNKTDYVYRIKNGDEYVLSVFKNQTQVKQLNLLPQTNANDIDANNTLFVDGEGKLKFKDFNGVIKEILFKEV